MRVRPESNPHFSELPLSHDNWKVGQTPLFIRVRPALGNVRSELKMAEHGRMWADNEIKALLEIWGYSVIQRQLKDSMRNVVVYRASQWYWK